MSAGHSGNPDTPEHARCREDLRERAAAAGTEVDVSTVVSRHPMAESFVCPHGLRYWILPTAEQIARWDAEDER